MPLVIGVTGSIAAGKSTVCRILEDLGATHCNADTLVHRLYDPGTPGFDRVLAEFGPDVLDGEGRVDRKALGGKVFGDPDAMRRLTRAMGDISGLIQRTIEEWRATLAGDASAVMEAVNLIEPGYSAWCDQTWLVVAESDTARGRLMARNGFSRDEADQRLTSQRDWRLRAPASDVIIHNDVPVAELEALVRQEFVRVRALKLADELPPSAYHGWRADNPPPQPSETGRSSTG